jgi:hypothetical protein
LGNNLCKAAAICLLSRLRTTARLLTLVLIEMPMRVLTGFAESVGSVVVAAASKEGILEDNGRKALNVK